MAETELAAVPQPRIPQLFYRLEVPATAKDPGGVFVPGFDAETQAHVAFVSLEYEDLNEGMDTCTLVFEDPNRVLANHPLLKMLSTVVTFSFGYAQGFGETVNGGLQRTMSHPRVMQLIRVEQNYPQSGKIITTLRFVSPGSAKYAYLRRNATYFHRDVSKRGVEKVKAEDVARQIAKIHGLTPVIEPTKVETGSAKTEWKQTNQTDFEFLRQIGLPLRAAGGREGAYQVMVRDNSLIFGPITVDEDVLIKFTYKGPNSPILNFRPKLPADLMKGAAWIAGYAGLDPHTGKLSPGSRDEIDNITNQTDEGQDLMGVGQIRGDTGEKGVTLENAGAAPRLPRTHDPEAARRRTNLEAIATVIRGNIDRERTDQLALGTPPDEIEAILQPLFDSLAVNQANIDALGLGDNSAITDFSPDAESNRNQAENFHRQSMMNALTADLEIFGWPAIGAGVAISVANVAEMFRGKWWVKKVIHRIDRTIGYVTKMDMQKNALGIANPTAGSQTPKRTPDRDTETVRVYDVDTGQEVIQRRAASTVSDMNRQTQRIGPSQNQGQRLINLQSLQTLHSATPPDATRVNIPTLIDADQAISLIASNRLRKALGG